MLSRPASLLAWSSADTNKISIADLNTKETYATFDGVQNKNTNGSPHSFKFTHFADKALVLHMSKVFQTQSFFSHSNMLPTSRPTWSFLISRGKDEYIKFILMRRLVEVHLFSYKLLYKSFPSILSCFSRRRRRRCDI